MKALSIRQPYAWLIVQGIKPVENRDRRFSYRGPLLIHASKTVELDHIHGINHMLVGLGHDVLPATETFERGGVVGCVEMVDCVDEHPSAWFHGKYGLVFERAEVLPFRPCRGMLGLFDLPATEEDENR